jgi:Cof subfamily protein (haloacid dehalogenase superfamily)
MVYRLLAIDIDGTLLRSNFRIDRETKEAVGYVQQKGVYVTLASGRSFLSAQKIAKALKIDSCLITHNGGFVSDSLDEPLYEKRLSVEDTYKIVDILENYECHMRVVHERFSVGNQLRQKSQLVAKLTLSTGDPLFYPVSFTENLGDYVLAQEVSPPKMDVQFFDEKECQSATKFLKEQMPDLEYTASTKCNLEITAKKVTKGNALRFLGEKLGIAPNEMVAIGDSYNDLDMIEFAGLGVAMANAPEEVKRKAKWITRTNDQLGVPYMVKEVFRKQMRFQALKK